MGSGGGDRTISTGIDPEFKPYLERVLSNVTDKYEEDIANPGSTIADMDRLQKEALERGESSARDAVLGRGIYDMRAANERDMQNMIGSAAGLAASGKITFAYGITPFVSLRVLEQLTIDVASMDLSVNVVSVGGGFTYSTDGPTHQGLQDLPAVNTIPNMTIFNSSDPASTRAFAKISAKEPGPKYIRIEKGYLPDLRDDTHDLGKRS